MKKKVHSCLRVRINQGQSNKKKLPFPGIAARMPLSTSKETLYRVHFAVSRDPGEMQGDPPNDNLWLWPYSIQSLGL